MSAPDKAVFLSYASQDADAARKICQALRAVHIEVWFDQNELVGGDAWDAKIRRQIAECGLFLPIISANTEARLEGYFRLEWKLAANRTHTMADEKPFLLPIVIDGTRDAGAKVPAEFRAVQWTRIGSADSLHAFGERVTKLLAGDALPAPRSTDGSTPGPEAQRKIPRRFSPAWLAVMIPLGVTLLALGGVAVKKYRDGGSKSVAIAPASDADELVARGYEILNNFHYRRDDLAVAEDFLRRATEQAPGSARAWAARAYVNSLYLLRGWDREEKRRQDTQTFANRALALNPKDTDAMLALAYLFNSQGASAQSEALMRTAMGLRTDDPRLPRSLGAALRGQQRIDESIATLQDVARRFPRDPLVRYELGLSYVARPDPAAAFAEFEAALAIQPFASALLLKAIHLANNQGDLSAARATLDQIETIDQTEDRAVGVSMWVGLLERSPERVVAAAALTARTYLEDNSSLVAHGPKAMTLALVHHVTGKEVVAQRHWQAAETLLRQRLREQPNDMDAQARLAICLARLGRQNEAEEIATRLEGILVEQRGGPAMLMAYYHAGRGDAAKALAHVRNPITRRQIFSNVPLALNPWFDPIRGQPEFERAVAEAAERRNGGAGQNGGRAVGSPAANSEPRTPPALRSRGEGGNSEPANPPAADSKSVAVLAFANLSDDRDNEYFSDGISEELLNVLAKVPGLKVSARTSAFSFKGKGVAIPEIARQLGVAYVVEGSVRKVGTRVRITAQLIKAADGFHVWSENFDRELKDIFAVQDEIAGLIAGNLQLKLGIPGRERPAVDPEAYQLYLQGRQAWNLRTLEAYDRAEPLLQRAVRLAPNFTAARAALVDVNNMRASFNGTRTAWRMRDSTENNELITLGREVVQLDPTSAEAHASLAQSYWMAWRLEESVHELREAIRLNPNLATAHQWLGRRLVMDGYVDEGLKALRRATELDPLSSRILDNYAWVLLLAGRPAEALGYADRALSVQSGAVQALAVKSQALADLGRMSEAAAIAATLPREASLTIYKGIVLARAGRVQEVERALPEFTDSHLVAKVGTLAALGRKREALEALEPGWIVSDRADVLLLNPAFDSLRGEPRFAETVAALGLAEAHERAQAWRAANRRTEDGGQRADKKEAAK